MHFVQFKHFSLKLQWRDSEKGEVFSCGGYYSCAVFLPQNQQAFGKAMGSSFSAVIANMVMEDAEKRACATLPAKPFF